MFKLSGIDCYATLHGHEDIEKLIKLCYSERRIILTRAKRSVEWVSGIIHLQDFFLNPIFILSDKTTRPQRFCLLFANFWHL